MNKRRRYLEKKWYEFAGKDLVVEGYLPNGEMACDDDVLDFIEEFLHQEIERAREEVFTEDERYHLVNLLEGGLRITDSISQSEIFKSILSKLKDNK